MQSSFFIHRPSLTSVLGLSISLFLLFVTSSVAQSVALPDKEVYVVVECPPEFPGGIQAMWDYLKANVNYPAEAQKAKIKDRVFGSFIVEKDGRITDIQLVKGIGYGCDEEAIRVIRAMPQWTPGSQSGRPLRVRYTLPLLFGLDYPKARRP